MLELHVIWVLMVALFTKYKTLQKTGRKKYLRKKDTLSNRKEKKWQNYKTLDSQREKQIQIEIKSMVTAFIKA